MLSSIRLRCCGLFVPDSEDSKDMRISKRGLSVLHGGDSPYYLGWKEYERNPYNPVSNPNGCIQLGLAESKLSLDLLQNWIDAKPAVLQLQLDELAGYPSSYAGDTGLRNILGSFMKELLGGGNVTFDPGNIVLTSGATAAIEILGFCLADPGDVFLVPAPYYPGFSRDCEWRSNIELFPVPCYSKSGFNITEQSLNSALNKAVKQGKSVRALLISSPSNPIGTTLELNTLKLVIKFALERNIHVICDEIYAGSTFNDPKFIGISQVVDSYANHEFYEKIKNMVHIVYGVSKDFGLPGLRVGILYSWNKQVLQTATRLCRFCAVSTQTQSLLKMLISDRLFMGFYISENKQRLKKRWELMTGLLSNINVKFIKGNAGFFCWVDLRSMMTEHTVDGETELWKRLVYEAGLNLTPGSACCCPEPGWFRWCFTSEDEETLVLAVKRVEKLIQT